METLIEATGLTKTYIHEGAVTPVLKGVSLTLKKGERLAIVGPSGAGKSTLLHILGMIDSPSAGRLFYKGQDVSKMSDAGLSRLRNEDIGFVFQFHHLLPEFNALENVMMPLLIRGLSTSEATEQGRKVLSLLGLSGKGGHRPAELSGGEQQRVAVARAMVTRPALLLADEPTGNLDHETGEILFQVLSQLSEEYGQTLVMVTHNTTLAEKMPRRLLLEDGQVIGMVSS